jgi:hypothetical protein
MRAMARRAFFLFLLIASSALAQPKITSISPTFGPASGGTKVTIRGSGFSTCTPCTSVWFSGALATSFTVMDANTIQAVTPPFAPVTVNVSVQSGGFVSLPNGFTYIDVNSEFERLLLPIFSPPVNGSFGSQFFTYFSIWNTAGADISVFAFAPPMCVLATCPPQPPGPVPTVLKARDSAPVSFFPFDGDPGRLLYIPRDAFDRMAVSLRSTDLSRLSQSFGTRMPIVPEREFRSDFIALIDLPTSAGFRITLRIYSLDPQTSVHIRAVSSDSNRVDSEMDVDLREPMDMFHPGYAQISDLVTSYRGRIEIEPRALGKHIWAFATATNNDTQQITVVAPH